MKRCIIVLMIMASILFSCRKMRSDKQVRIGIILPSIDHLPLSVALEKQYIDTAKLEIISFTSGWEVQEAITAGKIDLAIMPFTYAWTAISKGYKLKIVSCLERETDAIVALPEFDSIARLDKRKIGLLRASSIEALMQDTANRNKITYTPIYFRTPIDMIAALKTREVDAIVCYVPLIQKMGIQHQVLHWFSEDYPAHPCCDLVASEAILKSGNKIIKLINSGLQRAINDIQNPSEEIFDITKRLYRLNDLQAIEALRHTRFDLSVSEKDVQFEQQMMQLFKMNGYLKTIPDAKDVFLRHDWAD